MCVGGTLVRFIQYLHSTKYLTGKRGLDGKNMLFELVLCESQQQFSWRQTRVKSTHWISSRCPTRLGLGVHFLESCLELCGPCCTNVRGLWSTNNCIVAATAIPVASAPSFPSVISIAESLSVTQSHSGCWCYSLCYESACDLVIGLLHCNKYQKLQIRWA